ncbi:MAG: ornithine carbamoyltransferase [Candidatus Omnitrophica bacterium]|nr:ornithine carbamoyltransferase [Candidatus Omnitrophota bacterium]
MKHKDLISIEELTVKEVNQILDLSARLKANKAGGVNLKGKTLGLVFQKPSNRTRVSFWVGMSKLKGHCIYLSPQELQLGERECVKDAGRVLSRYLDVIAARTFSHKMLLELAKYSSVPVINALTDLLHPCQALSDILTIKEIKKSFKGIKLAYVGDGNNVLHSLLYAAAKVGLDISYAVPKGYEPNEEILRKAKVIAKKTRSKIEKSNDAKKAAEGADFIYTDVWTSMHQEKAAAKRKEAFKSFQINTKLLSFAKRGCLVMHCLPAKRGLEITDEIMDGPQSIVYDQAENRLYVEQAILYLLLKDNKR